MQINFGGREVTIKLVYYGPALSGKTTNLRALHELTTADSHGRLMTLETKDDRTLFFDMLPFVFRGSPSAGHRRLSSDRLPSVTAAGAEAAEKAEAAGDDRAIEPGPMTLRVKIFTVPGQVLHASTRRLVLQGADGVAFIADSQLTEIEHNAAAFLDLRENLKQLGVTIKELPLIIQFNKLDLPNVRTDAEILELASRGREPVFKASAVSGNGVLESFFGLLHLVWTKLDREHHLAKMVGVPSAEFLPQAARQLGTTKNVSDLLAACVGKNIEVAS